MRKEINLRLGRVACKYKGHRTPPLDAAIDAFRHPLLLMLLLLVGHKDAAAVRWVLQVDKARMVIL